MPQHDSFAEYLQSVPAAARPTLRSLRRTIQAVVPAATATLSYGIAAFRLDGRLLLGIGATAQHCAIYLMSAKTVRSCAELLADFDTSVGTVRFPHRRPPAPEIVRTLVETRLAEQSQPAPKKMKKTTEE
ncbi:MAG: iron chaperone [Planctomycetota bacterium]